MSDYRVDAVRVFSTDSCAALAFYRDTLGWPLRYAHEQLGWAQFDLSSCDIGLERMDADDPAALALVGRFVGVSIEVPDIQDTYRCWRRLGVEMDEPPAL